MLDVTGAEESAEQRLHIAVARWDAETDHGWPELVDAAGRALIEGLHSPALRALAEAPRGSSWDIEELVDRTLDELAIPRPGTLTPGHVVAAGGGAVRRSVVDELELRVEPATTPTGNWFELRVFVNGVERTSAGAGMGTDPVELFTPTNRLVAAEEPRTVPIARCICGDHGCDGTDVTIVREHDLVHWEWSRAVPMTRGATFDAIRYDAEVGRIASDRSWARNV